MPATLTTARRRKTKAAPATAVASLEVNAVALDRALSNGLLHAGRDDTLPVIASVLVKVDKSGFTFYATDRYTMIRERVEHDAASTTKPGAVLVGRADVELIAASLKKYLRTVGTSVRHNLTVRVELDPESGGEDEPLPTGSFTVRVGRSRLTFDGVTVATAYPDCDKIVDNRAKGDAPSAFAVGLNPNYLARVAKVKTDGGPAVGWLFSQDKPVHPVRAVPLSDDVDNPRLVVLVMPVRVNTHGDAEKAVEKW